MENSNGTTPIAGTAKLPEDGVTNVWMYAVIAAGTLFVIFLALGCYSMSGFFSKGPRPRKKDEEQSVKGADTLDGKTVIDGDIVETQINSYSQVPPVDSAALSHSAESDNSSVISADRTPPPPLQSDYVRRAVNPRGNVSQHGPVSHLHVRGSPALASVPVLDNRFDVVNGNRVLSDRYPPERLPSPPSYDSSTRLNPLSRMISSITDKARARFVKSDDRATQSPGRTSTLASAQPQVPNDIGENNFEQRDETAPMLRSANVSSPRQSGRKRERVMDKQNNGRKVKSGEQAKPVMKKRQQTRDDVNESPDHINSETSSLQDVVDTIFDSFASDNSSVSPDFKSNGVSSFSEDDSECEERQPELSPLIANGGYQKESKRSKADTSPCTSCGVSQSQVSAAPSLGSQESLGKTNSIRSFRSNISKGNLSITKGPSIRIAPKNKGSANGETQFKSDILFRNSDLHLQSSEGCSSPNVRSKPRRMGYTTFSSFDTETSSNFPSTSGSSGEEFISDQSMTDGSKNVNDSTEGGKSAKNIALNSIRRGHVQRKALREQSRSTTADSGIAVSHDILSGSHKVRKPAAFSSTGSEGAGSQTTTSLSHSLRQGTSISPTSNVPSKKSSRSVRNPDKHMSTLPRDQSSSVVKVLSSDDGCYSTRSLGSRSNRSQHGHIPTTPGVSPINLKSKRKHLQKVKAYEAEAESGFID